MSEIWYHGGSAGEKSLAKFATILLDVPSVHSMDWKVRLISRSGNFESKFRRPQGYLDDLPNTQ